MMLEGKKPLAAFCDVYPRNHNVEVIPEKDFAPYIEKGTFIKREHITTGLPCGMRRVLYALPDRNGELMPIFCYGKPQKKLAGVKVSSALEGRLLGYEEWQIDFHIENRFRKGLPHYDDTKSNSEIE